MKQFKLDGTLEELLEQVELLFPNKLKGPTPSDCLLVRDDGLWVFEVVNSWYKWHDKELETQFYARTPRHAVLLFLDYVKRKNINVKRLMDK